MQYKRLLVISHNAFGKENNMGRTLESVFSGWNSDFIAQLFFSEESPKSGMCENFFRLSDSDVIKSVFTRHGHGRAVNNLPAIYASSKSSGKLKTIIIKIARYRTPLIYCSRNLLWKIGIWESDALKKWLDSFNPEVVYFASGDYAFSYNIALKIAHDRNIPLVIGCFDDFYIGIRKTINPFYWLNRQVLMKATSRAFQYASCFTGACDKMTLDYEKLFNRKGLTLFIATSLHSKDGNKDNRIVYTGNLEYGRAEQLVAIGKVLGQISNLSLPHYMDVYSAEIRKGITNMLNEKNGIHFHGKIPSEKVANVIQSSKLVIHIESFIPKYQQRVAYSISTKIADCLASGTPIFAYGPDSVASIQYLAQHHAAFIVSSSEDLEMCIIKALTDESLRSCITSNAKSLVEKNHRSNAINKKILTFINEEAKRWNSQ